MGLIRNVAKQNMYSTNMIQDQLALEKLQKFLQANKLPHTDVKIEGSLYLGYHDEHGNLIGSGGLELYGQAALLRSVAVAETFRGHSIGKQIVDDMVAKARSLRMKSIYLLTETAQHFFLKKGFEDISRNEVPQPVRESTEFSHICPTSATCMIYKIQS